MSVPDEIGRHDDERDLLAAIAAVEGRGVLGEGQLESLDEARVQELEMAAGAVFTAFSVGTAAPPRGMVERLESALSARADTLGHVATDRDPDGAAAEMTTRRHGAPSHSRPDSTDRSGQRFDLSAAHGADAASGRPAAWPILVAASGWAAAAALVFVLVLAKGWGETPDPGARRAELLQVAPDAQVLAWRGGTVEGDVAWSDALNEGYMRIDGLPVNDPSESQYQLWIFRGTDPSAEKFPVDGGVFDISASGEIVVPIDAKIDVGGAGFFAITVEKPGGVVVSDRSQLVLAASRA